MLFDILVCFVFPFAIAFLVGWFIDGENTKTKCTLHSWSTSILDGKLYCMECNKKGEDTNNAS
jgi:lipid-A-disaccharide synthase-like uncharacterized protein